MKSPGARDMQRGSKNQSTNIDSKVLDVASKSILLPSPIRDDDGDPWDAIVEIGGRHSEPVLTLFRDLPHPFRADYLVATLLGVAARGGDFRFGWASLERRLSPVAVTQLAQATLKAIPGTAGDFEVRWRSNDPKVPF